MPAEPGEAPGSASLRDLTIRTNLAAKNAEDIVAFESGDEDLFPAGADNDAVEILSTLVGVRPALAPHYHQSASISNRSTSGYP